jgi:hypothetical protein
LSGWPDTKRETPVKIREYWHCREEISEWNLKNEKIIIPSSFRPEMLERFMLDTWEHKNARNVHRMFCVGQGWIHR